MNKLYQFALLKLIIFLLFSNILFASNELRLGVVGNFNSFNPYGLIGVNPKDYYILMYDSLMLEELDDLGNFKPLLAKSYQINGNDIIFNLNDKSHLSVSDVIYTFEIIKKYGNPYYKQKLAEVFVIEKIDDRVIRFKTQKFSQGLFNLIVALPIISEKYWKDKDFLAPSLEIPISNGAYFIEDFTLGKEIIFKKNPNYWGKDIPVRQGYFNFEKIIYKYVKTPNQLSELYKRGEISFKDRTTLDKLNQQDKVFIQKNKNIPTFKAYFLNINDIKLRKAVSYAYDFLLVKDYFLRDNQVRLQSLFENTSFKDTSFTFSNKADLSKVLQVLDGQKGVKIRFLFKSTEDFKISQDFMNNLKALGFEVTYKIPSFYDYIEMRKKREYDIIVEELLFSQPPQDELISYFTKGGEYNYANVDEIFLIKQITKKNRAKILNQLDLKLKQNYVYIPLYYDINTEYIYKDYLDFKNQDTLDIFKWWHK